ncbi:hypothetical protein OH802_21550 [Nocardioides sp. NBC_00850]|uniref:hypothetical protein n=1 Tax=Nocardioides sp. NBC_00850 TaxID=2976001 RepID=UPI002FC23685|nr:hypothetical protein OH802_21550 [Nocardioides sp. NBC_00850]
MDQNPREPVAAAAADAQAFEIRVAGLVPQQVLVQLVDIESSSREMRTVLICRCRDQAELHGFLARLRTFGLEVVEVRRLITGTADEEPTGGDA